ncbi:uncharacterized protein VTP21DRAFT_181 [Calcarisporiella thermophila]|uniref:uncharacterized protein n=1 Tax=Calcarisporiella thermophila TaxID=911321 RepID=UPI003743893A
MIIESRWDTAPLLRLKRRRNDAMALALAEEQTSVLISQPSGSIAAPASTSALSAPATQSSLPSQHTPEPVHHSDQHGAAKLSPLLISMIALSCLLGLVVLLALFVWWRRSQRLKQTKLRTREMRNRLNTYSLSSDLPSSTTSPTSVYKFSGSLPRSTNISLSGQTPPPPYSATMEGKDIFVDFDAAEGYCIPTGSPITYPPTAKSSGHVTFASVATPLAAMNGRAAYGGAAPSAHRAQNNYQSPLARLSRNQSVRRLLGRFSRMSYQVW